MVKLIKFFDDIEIHDFAFGFFPTASVPTVGPFGEDVDPKFGVGMDFATFSTGIFNSGNHGETFHADVSGVRFVT